MRITCALIAAILFAKAHAQEFRGDFWLDATFHFRLIDAPLGPISAKPDSAVAPDYTIKNAGDCSVAIKMAAAKKYKDPVILLTPGPYRKFWTLGSDWTLQFDIKQTNGSAAKQCTIILADSSGKTAQSQPLAIKGDAAWQHINQSLQGLTAVKGFEIEKTARVALRFDGNWPEWIHLDAVRFTNSGKQEIALTDQTTTQRRADEKATRGARIALAFKTLTPTSENDQNMFYYPVPSRDKAQPNLQRLYANLQMNREIDQTNRELLAIYSSSDRQIRANYGLEYTWDLQATPMLYRLYYNFGSKSTRHPGRLTPEVEKVILNLLWERTQYKNAIQSAQDNTWNMTGSENHDMNAKIANVLSSQIFMQEPEYAKRPYPNLGSGIGYGYWFHKTPQTGRFHGPEGTAPRKYPGDFYPADHYKAWVAFMKDYIRERAARGFFLERASPTYMRYTVTFVQDLRDYVADDELKKLAEMFLDLIWAEWAQDQIAGGRGGAKTRNHRPIVDLTMDAMYQMATFLFGGPARSNPSMLSFWLSDYRPPAIVWNLAMNRSALGTYAYVSRTPGEEPSVAPRPSGMERTLMADTESRLVRYSWVTPDYILGTQMDHPLALHSHLSIAGRSHGMSFSTRPDAVVLPLDIEINRDGKWQLGRNAVYRSLQEGPVMITQQSRWYASVSPEWFPNPNHDSRPFGIYFSPNLTQVEEENGWIFAEEGNAYLAVRIIHGAYQYSVEAESSNYDWLEYQGSEPLEESLKPAPYTWNENRTLLRCADRHSPIIFEAGGRADYPTLENFKCHILKNPVVLTKTTVPGWYTLQYKSNGNVYYFNAANSEIPRINGRPVDYAPANTFNSPYIHGKYRDSTISINDGRTRMVFDFKNATRTETSIH